MEISDLDGEEFGPDAQQVFRGMCTCLALRKAARRVTQIYDDALAPMGLTIGQFGLLAHIIGFEGASLQTISQAIGMDHSTLSRSLRPMARKKLITIQPSRHDARAREVKATARGRRIFDEAAGYWRSAQDKLSEHLSPDGQDVLRGHLLNTLKAIGA